MAQRSNGRSSHLGIHLSQTETGRRFVPGPVGVGTIRQSGKISGFDQQKGG